MSFMVAKSGAVADRLVPVRLDGSIDNRRAVWDLAAARAAGEIIDLVSIDIADDDGSGIAAALVVTVEKSRGRQWYSLGTISMGTTRLEDADVADADLLRVRVTTTGTGVVLVSPKGFEQK